MSHDKSDKHLVCPECGSDEVRRSRYFEWYCPTCDTDGPSMEMDW